MDSRVLHRGGIRVISERSAGHVTTTYQPVTQQTEIFDVLVGPNISGNHRTANPNSFRKTVITYANGWMNSVGPNGDGTYISGAQAGGPNGSGRPVFDKNTNNLRNRALAKLAEKSRGSLDLSIDLLEGHQTAAMLRKVAKLSNFIHRFSPKQWANNWLEYQYGWRPLAQSIYETASLMTKPAKEGITVLETRMSESERKQYVQNLSGLISVWEGTLNKRILLKVRLNFRPGTLQNLSMISSLNPVSIAWELLPYSFVADWVIDIGGYLRNMETAYLNDLIFMDGFQTIGYLQVWSGSLSGSQDLGGGSTTTASGTQIERETYKSRTVLSGYPIPTFPRVEVDLGWERVVSAGALLKQRFS